MREADIRLDLENIEQQILDVNGDAERLKALEQDRASLEQMIRGGGISILDPTVQINLALDGHGPFSFEHHQEQFLGNHSAELNKDS